MNPTTNLLVFFHGTLRLRFGLGLGRRAYIRLG